MSNLIFNPVNALQLKESEEQCIILEAELDTKTTSFQVETASIRRVHDEFMSTKADEVRPTTRNTTMGNMLIVS